MEQYFTNTPSSKDEEKSFEIELREKKFNFTTNNGVFSKDDIDFGSKLLIETFLDFNKKETGDFLDIGCGYGIVGIIIGNFLKQFNIIFSDVNERALGLTKKNIKTNNLKNTKVIKSDLYDNLSEEFDVILSNPPIRAGKKVVNQCFEGSFDKLKDSGELYVVIQKKQGAPSAIKKLNEIFGNCEVINKKGGYNILYCKK